MRPPILAGALVAAMTIPCASAAATTFCVPAHDGCSGTTEATLASALQAASDNGPGIDDVVLGAGHYDISPGVSASTANPVRIAGAGIDVTFLEGTYGSGIDPYTLSLNGPDQSVRDLTIHETAGGHHTALALDGGALATRVRVDQRDNTGTSTIAVLLTQGGGFADGEALSPLPHGGLTSTAIHTDGVAGQTATISGSLVQGGYAVDTSGAGSAIVSRSRLVGEYFALHAVGALTALDDSTVRGGPVQAYVSGSSGVNLVMRHDTLDHQQVQIESFSSGQTAHATLSNTAFVGGNSDFTQLFVFDSGGGIAQLDMDYSFYEGPFAVDQNPAPSATNIVHDGGHNISGIDAGLADLAGGDLRPRFDSPLVDKGDPAVADGETVSDLGGNPRTVNARTDIGAYEYQRQAPVVAAAAAPETALVGDTVTFSANALDADPGETPAVTWSFDDGGTASGLVVTHVFTTAGTHTATATATDPVGLAGSASAAVAVGAVTVPAKPAAPAFRFGAKLRARKGIVRLALACPPAAADCAGRIELQLVPKPKALGGAAKSVVLGRAGYAIAHGAVKTVRVKLTKTARKRLARAPRGLRVRVVARPQGAATRSRTVRLTGR